MVARIRTGKSIRSALHYNEQKVGEGKAELLLAPGFLLEPAQLERTQKLQRFERLLEKAPRVRTNTVHISLNFAPGEQLSRELLIRIASAYMERIGFGEQPYLLYRHLDAGHPHLHLVSTSIRPGGTSIPLHNIGRERSEPARKALEQEFGLVQAERKRQELHQPLPGKAVYGKTETKKAIAQVVQAVMGSYQVSSLAELNAVLRHYGVTADRGTAHSRLYQRRGLVYHLLTAAGRKAGIPIRASVLPGRPTLTRLEERFAHNQLTRQAYKQGLLHHLDQALLAAKKAGGGAFLRHLQQHHIQVLFREHTSELPAGVTFIDHHQKVVFTGSDLGTAYSARGLLFRLAGSSPSPKATPAAGNRQHNLPGPVSTEALGIPETKVLQALLQAHPYYESLPTGLGTGTRKRKKKKVNL